MRHVWVFLALFLWLHLSGSATSSPAASMPATIVAHRGGQLGETENSLAALREAARRGIEVIEFDVRTTRDGQLVIIHDETVDRTTNRRGRVATLSLAELRSIRINGNGEPIPTLVEALDAAKARQVRLLLDVKSGTSVRKVLDAVESQQAGTRVMLGLRRPVDVATARAEAPAIPIVAFMPKATDAATFAKAGADIIRLWSDWVEANPGLVGRTAALGPKVWILVGRNLPSKSSEWRRLHGRMLAIGAHGLITDRPDLISAAP